MRSEAALRANKVPPTSITISDAAKLPRRNHFLFGNGFWLPQLVHH